MSIAYHEEYHEVIPSLQTHTQGHGDYYQHNSQAAQQHFHSLILIPLIPEETVFQEHANEN